jgi:hypothetical protein
MNRPAASASVATPLFDWEAEPSVVRSSTFFQDSDYAPMPAHRSRRPGRAGVLWLGLGLVMGTGFVGLIELTPLLQRLFG